MKTPLTRSEQMATVRCKDTGPERRVRAALHASGLRYRLHARDLSGRPDIVFRSRRVAIFVHGCFWHRHNDPACKLARVPKSRLEFWLPKLNGNRERDARNLTALEAAGWRVLIVWECQSRDAAVLDAIVRTVRSIEPKRSSR